MSLEYRNEELPTTEIAEEDNFQRAIVVFPLYTFILIASLIAVFVCELAADGQSSIVTGGNMSVSSNRINPIASQNAAACYARISARRKRKNLENAISTILDTSAASSRITSSNI